MDGEYMCKVLEWWDTLNLKEKLSFLSCKIQNDFSSFEIKKFAYEKYLMEEKIKLL